MRAYEFIKPYSQKNIILEYKQDLTIRQFGPQLLNRIKQYSHPDYRWLTSPMQHSNFYDPETKQWDDQRLLKAMFRQFEDGDPTYDSVNVKGGIYVPWIAREYAKGNIRRFEDIDSRVKPLLIDYHKFKNRKDFWEPMPEIKDIMRVDFDHLEEYVGRYEPPDELKDRGKARTVYEDDTVRVVVPEDEVAACYYGQGTRWCTAATKGTNYFDHYSRQGPLYILLPKKPEYVGEKYQLHFRTDQYMDENDDPINVSNLLMNRFPGALEYFKRVEPDLLNDIYFAPDNILEDVYNTVMELLRDVVDEIIIEWEVNDDYYHQWRMEQAIEKEYFTPEYLESVKQAEENDYDIPDPEHEDIDWDRAYQDDEINDYIEYNDDARRLYKGFNDLSNISAKRIRQEYDDAVERRTVDDEPPTLTGIEDIINKILKNNLEHGVDQIDQYMSDNLTVSLDKPYFNPNREYTKVKEIDAPNGKYIIGLMGRFKKKS